jgi:hypothetical protein
MKPASAVTLWENLLLRTVTSDLHELAPDTCSQVFQDLTLIGTSFRIDQRGECRSKLMRLCSLRVYIIVLYGPFRRESGRVRDIFSSFLIDFLVRHDMNRVIVAGEPVALASDAKAWKCSELAKRLRTKPLAQIVPIPSLNGLTSPRLHSLQACFIFDRGL